MKRFHFTLLSLVCLCGCEAQQSQPPAQPVSKPQSAVVSLPTAKNVSLTEARRGFKSRLTPRESARQPVPEPPPNVFRLVRYESAPGKLAAYLTPDPADGKKHPAIVWITGGDCKTIDEGVWRDADRSNDQTAAAFRKAGIVMMFPSLRGGNDDPGVNEGFLGEVDDVLAATDYLAGQS